MKFEQQIIGRDMMESDYPMGLIEQLACKEAELQQLLQHADELKQQINSLCERSAHNILL